MARIDRKTVLHVAALANLELTDDEAAYYETQLGKVLDHIAALEAMPDALGASWRGDTAFDATPERPDVERPSLSPEEAVREAPRKAGTAFQVPRIIET